MEAKTNNSVLSPVFFIGASAGGVAAFRYIAESLPEDFPAPVFFLLHKLRENPKRSGDMQRVLQANSKLRVVYAQEGDAVRAGHIYLPPDNLNIGVEDNCIEFSDKPGDATWRPSIDYLFKSGAREYKDRAISILLTGKLDDGIEGLRETSFQGGITVAQSPDDAYAPYLPLNAVLNDHPSHVLPLDDLPKLMCELAGLKHFDNQEAVLQESAAVAKQLRQRLKHVAEPPLEERP